MDPPPLYVAFAFPPSGPSYSHKGCKQTAGLHQLLSGPKPPTDDCRYLRSTPLPCCCRRASQLALPPPMNGLWDGSPCTYIEATAATLAMLSKSQVRIQLPRRGRAQTARLSGSLRSVTYVHWLPAWQQLYKHDSVAVDVALDELVPCPVIACSGATYLHRIIGREIDKAYLGWRKSIEFRNQQYMATSRSMNFYAGCDIVSEIRKVYIFQHKLHHHCHCQISTYKVPVTYSVATFSVWIC